MEICVLYERCTCRCQERGIGGRRWRSKGWLCRCLAEESVCNIDRFSVMFNLVNDVFILFARTDPNSTLPMPTTVPTKPYDWTYTTTYAGHPFSHTEDDPPIISSPPLESMPWTPADPDKPSHSIPMAELTRPDPIIFYAEIPLFEDELHDNGSSNLLVRIVSILFHATYPLHPICEPTNCVVRL